MSTLAVLNIALVVLSLQLLALTVAAVAGRGWNRRRTLRSDHLAEQLRGAVVLLAAGEPEEVADAVEELAAAGPREWRAIEPSVVGLLSKVRGDAHAATVEVLRRRGLIDAAMRDLQRHWFATRRARAAELLGAAGVASAVGVLIAALSDREPQVRVVAARALGRVGGSEAVGPLLDSIDAGVPPRVVASAVAGIERTSAMNLTPSLLHPRSMHRAIAAEVAGLVTALETVPVLVSLLEDPELEVRIRAARALGRCGVPETRPALQAATESHQPVALRVVATRALVQVAGGAAVTRLAELLADPIAEVAQLAAEGLLDSGVRGEQLVVAAGRAPGLQGEVARSVMAQARLRGRQFAPVVARSALPQSQGVTP